MTIAILVALNVIAGALPAWGLARLALRVWRDYRLALVETPPEVMAAMGTDAPKFALSSWTKAGRDATVAPFMAWRNLRWDIGLIGTGVIAGTVANVWSLFL